MPNTDRSLDAERLELFERQMSQHHTCCADWHYETVRALIRLWRAVQDHHRQKADDRCIEDDDRIYEAAHLPPCDRRVGSKDEMLKNCARFIERRCLEGGWPTYASLETEVMGLKAVTDHYEVLTPLAEWAEEDGDVLWWRGPSASRRASSARRSTTAGRTT
jgi:hypothetical protein